MERPQIDTALQAANVALTGRRRQQTSSIASIELRDEAPKKKQPPHWELMATVFVGAAAFVAVIVAWIY
jgi:hypothetical protein